MLIRLFISLYVCSLQLVQAKLHIGPVLLRKLNYYYRLDKSRWDRIHSGTDICYTSDLNNDTLIELDSHLKTCTNVHWRPQDLTVAQVTWKPIRNTGSSNKNDTNALNHTTTGTNTTEDSNANIRNEENLTDTTISNNLSGVNTSNRTNEEEEEDENDAKPPAEYLIFLLSLPHHPFSYEMKRLITVLGPLFPDIQFVTGSGYDFHEMCMKYNIKAFPRLMFFRKGRYIKSYKGKPKVKPLIVQFSSWVGKLPSAIPFYPIYRGGSLYLYQQQVAQLYAMEEKEAHNRSIHSNHSHKYQIDSNATNATNNTTYTPHSTTTTTHTTHSIIQRDTNRIVSYYTNEIISNSDEFKYFNPRNASMSMSRQKKCQISNYFGFSSGHRSGRHNNWIMFAIEWIIDLIDILRNIWSSVKHTRDVSMENSCDELSDGICNSTGSTHHENMNMHMRSVDIYSKQLYDSVVLYMEECLDIHTIFAQIHYRFPGNGPVMEPLIGYISDDFGQLLELPLYIFSVVYTAYRGWQHFHKA